MNIRGSIGVLGGCVLLAAWLSGSAATSVEAPRAARPAPAPPTADSLAPVVQQLQVQTDRLHDRQHEPPTPRDPGRNLFEFAARAPKPSEAPKIIAPPPPAAVMALPAPPPRPAYHLIGMAEESQADGVRRTAVISGPTQLYLVKEGDAVGPTFKVSRIGADAVELVDAASGATMLLGLR